MATAHQPQLHCALAHASDSMNSVSAEASCPSFASAVVSAKLTRRCMSRR